MFNATTVQALPGVIGTVLGDSSGTLMKSLEDPDGETTAAVSAFAASHFTNAGLSLGLGEVDRVTIGGGSLTAILRVAGDVVLTVRVEASRPATVIEKKLDTMVSAEGDEQ